MTALWQNQGAQLGLNLGRKRNFGQQYAHPFIASFRAILFGRSAIRAQREKGERRGHCRDHDQCFRRSERVPSALLKGLVQTTGEIGAGNGGRDKGARPARYPAANRKIDRAHDDCGHHETYKCKSYGLPVETIFGFLEVFVFCG